MSGSGGTVRQRSNGLWEGRYWHDGRRRSTYGKTKREAQDKLRQAMLAANSGVKPTNSRLTVADYLDSWLAAYVNDELRPRTAESYRMMVRLYLKPHLGRIPLTKLEPDDVKSMLRKIAPGRSATTVAYVRTVLRVALGRALKDQKVQRNVATLVDPLTRQAKTLTPLTVAQVRAFLDSVSGDRRAPLYMAAITLGLRQGELLGLRWSDVDLDGGGITIRNQLQRLDGVPTLVPPKTEQSKRSLDLPASVVRALREHRVRQLEERLAAGRRWQDGDFVFTSTIGTPLDGINVTHGFQAALAAAGLPRQRFHDLRHACATLLLENGEDLAVVSKLLGHSSYTTTANVYAHLTRDMRRRAANTMDAIVQGAG
jgi:integrase